MEHTVDAIPLVGGRQRGQGPEALSACAAVVWRGVVGLAPALRAAALTLFKAMGKGRSEPMMTAVPIPIGTILAEPAVCESLSAVRSSEDMAADLRQTFSSTARPSVCGMSATTPNLTGSFARSPFLDICEMTKSTGPDRQVAAWLVRCGQWACWRLNRGDREDFVPVGPAAADRLPLATAPLSARSE